MRKILKSISLVTVFGFATIGCSGIPHLDDNDVQVLYARPSCTIVNLGTISAQDGHAGHMSGQRWGPRGTDENALRKLRAEALKIGADKVLIVTRSGGARESGPGSIQARPGRVVRYTGHAFNECT